jgi:hypothetical protein
MKHLHQNNYQPRGKGSLSLLNLINRSLRMTSMNLNEYIYGMKSSKKMRTFFKRIDAL